MRRGVQQLFAAGMLLGCLGWIPACNRSDPEVCLQETYQGNPPEVPRLNLYSLGRIAAQRKGNERTEESTGFLLLNSRKERYILGAYQPFGRQGVISAARSDLTSITQVELYQDRGALARSRTPVVTTCPRVATPTDASSDLCCFYVEVLSEDAAPMLLTLHAPLLQETLWIYAFDDDCFDGGDPKPKVYRGTVCYSSNKRITLEIPMKLPLKAVGSPAVNAAGEVAGIYVLPSEQFGKYYAHLVPREAIQAHIGE